MDEKQQRANNINSINRAFEILHLFKDSWELGIQDISQLTGLNKTTVFRVVKTLEANRMLEQSPRTAKYHPGFAIVELAHSVYKNFNVKYIFLPYMRRLREEFNEDVILSVLSDTHAVCIERMEGNNAINLHSRVGRALPIYGGSTARVFLPFVDQDVLQRVYQEAESQTGPLIPVSRETLDKNARFVREHGYLISCGVTDAGVLSVSVPVQMDSAHIYSLAVCGVEERMYSKGIDVITARLLDYSRQVSDKLACCDVIGK